MKGYIAKKIMFAIITLYIIATLNFMIFQVFAKIDPVALIMSPELIRRYPNLREEETRRWGLDQPIPVRYVQYITNMFTFHFGYSLVVRLGTPVGEVILTNLGRTMLLMGLAMTFEFIVGVVLGVLAATRRGSKLDVATIGAGLFAWGVPVFFIQLLFLLAFVHYLRWFPAAGITSLTPPQNPIALAAEVLYHLFLPVTTLVVSGFGYWALYTRNLMLDSLTQDYVVTARAKGLKERTVLYKHAFKAILPPIITVLAMSTPALVTGSLITEFIFSYPGMGRLLYDAVIIKDYPVEQGIFFVVAIIMVGANLIADSLYGLLDPRIRVGVRR